MKFGVGVVAVVVGWTCGWSPRAAFAQTLTAPDVTPPAPDAAPPPSDATPPAPDAAAPTPVVAPPEPVATPPVATDVAPPVHPETSARKFVNVGFGIGGVSRIGDVPPTSGASFRLQFGQRLAHGVHLVEEISFLVAQDYVSPVPTNTSEDHFSFGAGVRWTPFEPRPHPNTLPLPIPGPIIDSNAFYVTAVLGADSRNRSTWVSPTESTDQSAWSPMASLAVGLPAIQGHDWSLGPEVREQLQYFDGHVQRSWMAMFVAELQQW
jgi:hypothetical protein